MCPIIDGADLTEVSTDFEVLPEGDYVVTIKDVVEGKTKKNQLPQVIVQMQVTDGNSEFNGKPISDFITLKQNDGKKNEIGLKQLKRYFEAVLGKEAANTTAPDTDLLKDKQVRIMVSVNKYTPEGETEERTNNKIKRIFPA